MARDRTRGAGARVAQFIQGCAQAWGDGGEGVRQRWRGSGIGWRATKVARHIDGNPVTVRVGDGVRVSWDAVPRHVRDAIAVIAMMTPMFVELAVNARKKPDIVDDGIHVVPQCRCGDLGYSSSVTLHTSTACYPLEEW